MTDDKEISKCLTALCEDHEMQLSVPSVDGLDGAAWDVIDITHDDADVLRQAAADDNLHAAAPGGMHRVQVSAAPTSHPIQPGPVPPFCTLLATVLSLLLLSHPS